LGESNTVIFSGAFLSILFNLQVPHLNALFKACLNIATLTVAEVKKEVEEACIQSDERNTVLNSAEKYDRIYEVSKDFNPSEDIIQLKGNKNQSIRYPLCFCTWIGSRQYARYGFKRQLLQLRLGFTGAFELDGERNSSESTIRLYTGMSYSGIGIS
jgi:hypothetical protein